MEVQCMDVWEAGGADGAGSRLYAAADSEWVVPARFGTFGDFSSRLTRFHKEEQDEVHTAVVVWSDPRKATPAIPIVHPHYPTVCLIVALRAAGYYSHAGLVRHTALLVPPATGHTMDERA